MTMVKHFVAHKKLGTEGQFKAGLQCNVAQRSNFPPPAAVSVSVCSTAPCDRTPVPGPRLSLTLPSLTLHSPSAIIAKVTLLFQYVIYAISILYRIYVERNKAELWLEVSGKTEDTMRLEVRTVSPQLTSALLAQFI